METTSDHSSRAPGFDLVSFAFNGPVDYDPTKPLYIDASKPLQNLNAGQVKSLTRKLVAGFKAAQLAKGGRVLVHLFNHLIYTPIFFGILGAEGIFVGSNPAYRFFELDELYKLVEPTVIITSSDLLPTILQVVTAGGKSPSSIYCADAATLDLVGQSSFSGKAADTQSSTDQNLTSPFEELLSHGEHEPYRIPDQHTARTTLATFFTTSGTTGLPKAATFSHDALINLQLSYTPDVPFEVVRSLSLPCFHLFGYLFSHVYPIRLGQPLILSRRYNTEEWINVIYKHKVTHTFMSPQMLFAVNSSGLPLKQLLHSVRDILCAGENMSTQAQLDFCSNLSPDAVLNQGWGMTEVGCVTRFLWPEQDTTGSVGRVAPLAELRLIDAFGEVVSRDEELGEAYVRTKMMTSGYWKLLHSSLVDQDGWFATGDILWRKDGKYYIKGRAKDLIKVKGWQVSPSEIEIVLRQHKCIADAAIVGVRSENGQTEVPLAFVVRKPDSEAQDLQSQDVYSFARERLASFKALDGGVVFVKAIPRSALGKIQRFKLKDMVGEGSSTMNGELSADIAEFAKEAGSEQKATNGVTQTAAKESPHINGVASSSEDLLGGRHTTEENDGRN